MKYQNKNKCIVILFILFTSYFTPLSICSDYTLSIQEGQIFGYMINDNDIISYKKYNITEISENNIIYEKYDLSLSSDEIDFYNNEIWINKAEIEKNINNYEDILNLTIFYTTNPKISDVLSFSLYQTEFMNIIDVSYFNKDPEYDEFIDYLVYIYSFDYDLINVLRNIQKININKRYILGEGFVDSINYQLITELRMRNRRDDEDVDITFVNLINDFTITVNSLGNVINLKNNRYNQTIIQIEDSDNFEQTNERSKYEKKMIYNSLQVSFLEKYGILILFACFTIGIGILRITYLRKREIVL